MKKDINALLKRHEALTHSDMKRVISHVQRAQGDWILNTIMIEGCATPFRYKRRKKYNNLKGARINLTYYPAVEQVAGIEMDVMNVVRIRRS